MIYPISERQASFIGVNLSRRAAECRLNHPMKS